MWMKLLALRLGQLFQVELSATELMADVIIVVLLSLWAWLFFFEDSAL